MALTGNKGEWSEIYTFFKLIGDRKLYSGDENLNRIEDLFYPIVKILRSELRGNYEYSINQDFVVVSEDGTEVLRKSVDDFVYIAKELYNVIKKSHGAFAVPEIEAFMNSVHCYTLKAKSTEKTDIRIVIHDLRTGMCPLLGFSIKSQLGGKSTLLNSSGATNFTYILSNAEFSDEEIDRINRIDTNCKIQDRIKEIEKKGGTLSFKTMDNRIFNNNLVLIDSFMPNILSELLLLYYTSGVKYLKDLTEAISKCNPMGYNTVDNHRFYEHKVKCLLTDAALGMLPATVWSGIYDANGGYLVVKKDGDILCYHLYNRNVFEDYLFNRTFLETGSSSRSKFGLIEKHSDGTLIFKLNLQIRFMQ